MSPSLRRLLTLRPRTFLFWAERGTCSILRFYSVWNPEFVEGFHSGNLSRILFKASTFNMPREAYFLTTSISNWRSTAKSVWRVRFWLAEYSSSPFTDLTARYAGRLNLN